MFLIDNSETMKQYRTDVAKVVSLLTYVLKDPKEEKLNMLFTHGLYKVNSKKSSKFESAIYQEQFRGISDIRGRLQTILQGRINRFGAPASSPTCFTRRSFSQSQRPLTCYILTDGKYQPTDVDGFIRDLGHTMRDERLPREHVAFSFIRFGNDPEGIARLDILDHGLGLGNMYVPSVTVYPALLCEVLSDKLGAIDRDNVDHTPWDGNIWKQLLGPINDWYDDDHHQS